MSGLGQVWKLARAVEDLLESQRSTREALKIIDGRLRALEDRMLGLEANERQMITEAKAASTAAASTLIGGVLSDTISRITRLEGRFDNPPPISNAPSNHQITGPR